MVLSRRRMLTLMGAGGGLIAALLCVPVGGFVLSPLFTRQRHAWVEVGEVDSVPLDVPTPRVVLVPIGEGPPPNTPVPRVVYIVRRSGGALLALSNTCTHMQCNVRWNPALGQFLCPCHGGLYDMSGRNVGGPPPSPLPQWVHRLRTDASGRTVLDIRNQYDEAI